MIEKIEKLVGDLSGKQVGVLGLSFKPETDDMRESPAVDIIRAMNERGAKIRAYDPVAIEEAKHCLPEIEYASDEYEALKDADAVVIATEWNQFRALDMGRVKSLLRQPKIADLRNVYEPEDMRELGFDYVGVGR
jgi:UDPglucose 6-dehydrogenase